MWAECREEPLRATPLRAASREPGAVWAGCGCTGPERRRRTPGTRYTAIRAAAPLEARGQRVRGPARPSTRAGTTRHPKPREAASQGRRSPTGTRLEPARSQEPAAPTRAGGPSSGTRLEPARAGTGRGIRARMRRVMDGVKTLRGVETYKLVCDTSNNTADTRNNREVIIDLSFIPVDAAERIYLNASVYSSGADLNSITM